MILNIIISNKRPLRLLAGVFAVTALILFANASLAFSREQGWQGVVEDIEKKLDSSIESYRRGDVAVARALIMDSYFEGFEAILVIGAIIAYLKNSGNIRKTPAVYKGVAFALIASVLTAFFFHSVIVLGGKSMEAIEGITMLLATAVLFYVSFWLISKVEVKRWHDYIRRKVSGS